MLCLKEKQDWLGPVSRMAQVFFFGLQNKIVVTIKKLNVTVTKNKNLKQ
jgi:hypothetical protein